MRKIAEHQVQEENVEIPAGKEEKKADTPISQPSVQLVTMEQMTNLKLDDINAKLDFIIQWIQTTQLPPKLETTTSPQP